MDYQSPGDLTASDGLFNSGEPWQMETKLLPAFLRDHRYVGDFQGAAEVLVEYVGGHGGTSTSSPSRSSSATANGSSFASRSCGCQEA